MKYREEQTFGNWELKLVLWSLVLFGGYRFVQLSTGPQDASRMQVVGCIAVLLAMLFLIDRIYLKVKIDKKGIKYRHSWWKSSRRIKWSEIKRVRICRSTKGAQLSGWNVQFAPCEPYHSLVGQTGLEIGLLDGTRSFIGMQNPDQCQVPSELDIELKE